MQLIINVLGALTAGLCAVLLLRGYFRVRKRLLLWCGLCFTGLTASNLFLIADLYLTPNTHMYTQRLMLTAISMLIMLYGLIFESERP